MVIALALAMENRVKYKSKHVAHSITGINDAYAALGSAVVLQAIHDYVDAIEKEYRLGPDADTKGVITQVKLFFSTGRADAFLGTDTDASYILRLVESKAKAILASGKIPKGKYRVKLLFASLSK